MKFWIYPVGIVVAACVLSLLLVGKFDHDKWANYQRGFNDGQAECLKPKEGKK